MIGYILAFILPAMAGHAIAAAWLEFFKGDRTAGALYCIAVALLSAAYVYAGQTQ